MKRPMARLSTIFAIGFLAGAMLSAGSWTGASVAIAASAQQKVDGKKTLDRMMRSLRAVDTAYASGNAAEAKSRFADARRSWNSIARMISAREAREQQLLLDNLDRQLKSGASATQVKSTVEGMLDELREDIERELR